MLNALIIKGFFIFQYKKCTNSAALGVRLNLTYANILLLFIRHKFEGTPAHDAHHHPSRRTPKRPSRYYPQTGQGRQIDGGKNQRRRNHPQPTTD